jgi:hypothetical protein
MHRVHATSDDWQTTTPCVVALCTLALSCCLLLTPSAAQHTPEHCPPPTYHVCLAVFPLYQSVAVDEDGPEPHLRTTWPDRSGALMLQNLWDTYVQVGGLQTQGLTRVGGSSASSGPGL